MTLETESSQWWSHSGEIFSDRKFSRRSLSLPVSSCAFILIHAAILYIQQALINNSAAGIPVDKEIHGFWISGSPQPSERDANRGRPTLTL